MRGLGCTRRFRGTLGATMWRRSFSLFGFILVFAASSAADNSAQRASPQNKPTPDLTLDSIPESQRTYCGDYVFACLACQITGGTLIFDRGTQQLVAGWGGLRGFSCLPDDTPETDCHRLKERVEEARKTCDKAGSSNAQSAAVAPNSPVNRTSSFPRIS